MARLGCAIVLLLGVALAEDVTPGTSTTTTTTTVVPVVKPKVCEVCECTAEIVDCSSRKLSTTLHDHEWPSDVKIITFENNEISKVMPFPQVKVHRLSLRNNKIERIESAAFKFLVNLTELDLSHNELNFENLMPIAFEGHFQEEAYEPLSVKLLNLANNKFHSLHRDLFEHLGGLKTLILSNNPFSLFDTSSIVSISSIPYLEELHLNRCKLQKMDEVTFHSLKYLKKMDISYNEFTKVPDSLRHANALETLNMDGNPIESLGYDNSFPEMPKLKELSMCDMPELMTIDKGALSNLEFLESLTIENCPKLAEVSDLAFAKPREEGGGSTWPPLKRLEMSNNALRSVPANFVARWDKLEGLNLTRNPWTCDCENQYLIGTLLPELGRKLMPAEYTNLRCASPPEHKNKTLISLSGWKLRCPDMYGARPERDAAVLVGMLIGVLLAIPIVLVIFILWRRGFFFCGPQGPASFSRAFYKRTSPYDDDM